MIRNISITDLDDGWHVSFEYRTWNLGWTLNGEAIYRSEVDCQNFIDRCAKDALLFSLESIVWNSADKITSPDSIPHKALGRLKDGIKYLHDNRCELPLIKEIIVKLEAFLSVIIKKSSADLPGDQIKLTEMISYCKIV